MSGFFDNMDSENKTWLGIVVAICGVGAVVAVCLCVNCAVINIYNPEAHKSQRTEPTIKARLVPVE